MSDQNLYRSLILSFSSCARLMGIVQTDERYLRRGHSLRMESVILVMMNEGLSI